MNRGETPLNRSPLLLAAAGLLFATGVVLAIAKPGDLGGDDDRPSAAVATTTSTTRGDGADAPVSTTDTTTPSGTDGVGSDGTGTTPTSTIGASGLGESGAGQVDDDDLANTGGPALLVPAGVGLLAAAGAARHLARRS